LAPRNLVPDPIHGTIEIPSWLLRIANEKSVRRMMFIRQLGLKAYIDYPGAIHTRYSHVLGVMHLSGRIIGMLSELEYKKGRTETATSLSNNKINIMAAGFLHDIGHGPFSHVVDYILKKYCNITHEEMAFEIMKRMPDIENDGINIAKVREIIKGKHPYRFINHIINGPVDADKLDYLLRDAHHVGLKYSLDLDHFITNFRILGIDSSRLSHCELGLANNDEALVTSDIFMVIWKSMYDLVYHIRNSRIAEKMFEKALILRLEDDKEFKSHFTQVDKFIELNDEILFESLKGGKGLSAKLIEGIRANKLYEQNYDRELSIPSFNINQKFLDELNNQADDLSDTISCKMAEELNCEKYGIICDIVKSRIPKPVNIEEYDEAGEPIELKSRSDIIDSIKEKIRIKIYVKEDISNKINGKLISCTLNEMVCSW
jgi:HD superfamily phosphohydrolase